MSEYDIVKKIEALEYTQKTLDAVNGTWDKTLEICDMIKSLKSIRKELAYEIFRSE